jgi:2',3'-cyclic-nucleotide 2'-phosphodiesterase (5'-nucleotidase family)
VLYLDAGDVEEPTSRLSNLTKGSAMHRLLTVAGCDAAAAGNGAWMRYGPQVVRDHAAAAGYPLVLANLRGPDGCLLPGAQPSVILSAGPLRLGLIGVTAATEKFSGPFGLSVLHALPLIRELAASLKQDGADMVVLLSHMGLPVDRELAGSLQDDVIAIIGGHSHDLLPEGERIGRVLITQAGKYAEHIGRVEIGRTGDVWAAVQASVVPVEHQIRPFQAVLAEAWAIEVACQEFLDEVVGELAQALDFATDRECGVADWMADVLRERMSARLRSWRQGRRFWATAGCRCAEDLVGGLQLHGQSCAGASDGSAAGRARHQGLDPALLRPLLSRCAAAHGASYTSAAQRFGGSQLLIAGEPIDPDRLYLVAGTDWGI